MTSHDDLLEASALLAKRFAKAHTHQPPTIATPETYAIDTEILAQALSLTIHALRRHIIKDHH